MTAQIIVLADRRAERKRLRNHFPYYPGALMMLGAACFWIGMAMAFERWVK
jgi:hypothetical protein